MFEGNKFFGDIKAGTYLDVSDQSKKLAWNADYKASHIDDDPDGLETVTCVIDRLAVTDLSLIEIKQSAIQYFYAGFNVWEDQDEQERLTGGVSNKIEIKMFEDESSA